MDGAARTRPSRSLFVVGWEHGRPSCAGMLRTLGIGVAAVVGAVSSESLSLAVHVPPRHTSLARPSVVCADPADCTPELQSALDRGGTIVLSCGHAADPWITRPLNVTQNNTWIGIAAGCSLVAKRHEFHGVSDALITVRELSPGLRPEDPGRRPVRNVSIVGIGGQATLRMWRGDYNDSSSYTHAEHRHGIAIRNAMDVTVSDLNVTLTGGDGLYVAGLVGGHFKRVHCTANYRQGSSVIDACHVLYEDCSFSETSGTPPMSGVDIEPNAASQSFVNLTFRRCVSADNAGAGFLLDLYHLTAQSQPLGVRFEDCVVRNVGLQSEWHGNSVPGNGLVVSSSSQNQSKTTAAGSIVWQGGFITDTAWEGVHIARPESGALISIENVHLARTALHMSSSCTFNHAADCVQPGLKGAGVGARVFASKGTPNPIFVLANAFASAGAVVNPEVDGVLLRNVVISDSLPRPFAFVAGPSRNVLSTNLTVENSRANGCGSNIVVPFGKPAHFAAYGGNVNLSVSRCVLT